MGDLAIGFAILASASLIVFSFGAVAFRSLQPRGRFIAALVSVFGLAGFFAVWQSPAMARLLPFSNLIVVSNWTPILAAIVAALVWSDRAVPPVRRRVLACLAMGAGFWMALHPLLGSPPPCSDLRGPFGDSRQSTTFTCSAASAATFLRAHGIEATEEEMAELCLTRQGTSWMGLYRGLKLKTHGTRWDVELVTDRDTAIRSFARQPILVNVGLSHQQAARADFAAIRDEDGWIPGVEHTVVLLGRGPANTYKVADPTPGIDRELWNPATLDTLWRGMGFRLVERNSPTIAVLARNFD